MRLASTGPGDEGEAPRASWFLWFLPVLALVAPVGAVGWGLASCYPQPPVNPPSCAQDPTQSWCAPPAFSVPAGCTSFRVDVDRDSGVRDELGVWHYHAR